MQGKRLPAYLSADAEEGEVSDDDSADEIEDDFKLKSSNVRERNKSMNYDVHTPKHEPSNYHVQIDMFFCITWNLLACFQLDAVIISWLFFVSMHLIYTLNNLYHK